MNENDFPPHILKQLSDRSQDKRQQAANHIQEIVSQIVKTNNKNDSQIQKIIQYFTNDFMLKDQNNANKKKGVLKVLAAIAIAISEDEQISIKYVEDITAPLIKELSGTDSKIRYAAIESLYYVCKAFGPVVLLNFNQIFSILVDKVGDFDDDVKKATTQLDNTLKGIINDALPETKYFNLKDFMPLICEKIKAQHPLIRQMLIGWIITLGQIPNLNILDYLPQFLEGLFTMLGDKTKDIRNSANDCLNDFLREIKDNQTRNREMIDSQAFFIQSSGNNASLDSESQQQLNEFQQQQQIAKSIHPQILEILIKIMQKEKIQYHLLKFRAMEWIYEYLSMYLDNIEYSKSHNNSSLNGHTHDVLKGELGQAIIQKISLIIEVTLINLSNEEEEIRKTSQKVNELLLLVTAEFQKNDIEVNDINDNSQSKLLVFHYTFILLYRNYFLSQQGMLNNKRGSTMEMSLQWMRHLLGSGCKGIKMKNALDDILSKLIDKLYNFDGNLVQKVLDVLGKISLNEEYFDKVIEKILNVCFLSKEQLDKKSDLIVKTFALIKTLEKFSKPLQISCRIMKIRNFIATFVQSLDTLLLTDKQLGDCRSLLRNMNYDIEKKEKISIAFRKAVRNMVLQSCVNYYFMFLGQQYELAYRVIMCFQDMEIDAEILMQIAKLVNFLESPHFIFLRLCLLEHQKYPFLLKSLQGLMMLLPQGKIFDVLKQRLKCATIQDQSTSDLQNNQQRVIVNKIDIQKHLQTFQNRQKTLKIKERKFSNNKSNNSIQYNANNKEISLV